MKSILITGAAGFIGSRLIFELAQRGNLVVGVDNINDYYDVRLKYGRLKECGFDIGNLDMPWNKEYASQMFSNLRFLRLSIDNEEAINGLFERYGFNVVVNLAAQAGVRYSITNPYSYLQSNLVGFLNVLEACRNTNVPKLVFASSSSVYGMNTKVPFSEDDKVDEPVSLYAATKKSNELMAHCYSKLYGIQAIGLRFFTVYGPWGRPDMSPMLFADALRTGQPIKVFNNGNMFRDFTYIDDIVEGTMRAVDYDIEPNNEEVTYRIYNIVCGHPVSLMEFIEELEKAYGRKSEKVFLPMQQGDVYQTYADTTRLEHDMGYHPHWTLHDGIVEFVKWYKNEKNPLVDNNNL